MKNLRKKSSKAEIFVFITIICAMFQANLFAQKPDNQASQKKIEQAEKLFDEGLDLAERETLKDYQNALIKLEKARTLYQEIGDKQNEAYCNGWLGNVHKFLGNNQKALEFYNQSLVLVIEIGDKSEESANLNSIGQVYINLGEKRKALEYFEKSLTIKKEVGDKKGESDVLNNMGVVYKDLGEMSKALEVYNKSLLLSRELGDKGDEAITLSNIGSVYDETGEKQKAIEYYSRALSMRKSVGDKSGEADTLNSMGVMYRDLGEYKKALELFQAALPIKKQIGDRLGEGMILNNIGDLYSIWGENQKALDYFKQALTLRQQTGDKDGIGNTLNNIGVVYGNSGDDKKALEYHLQSLALFREVGNKAEEANALNNLAALYNKIGEKEKALETFSVALPLSRLIGNLQLEADTLAWLMIYWKDSGNSSLAIFYGKQAVNVFQQLRANIKGLDKSVQQTYLNTVEVTYRDLADLLIAEGRLTEAQSVLNLLKEEEYAQTAKRGGSDDSTAVPYSKTETAAFDKIEKLVQLGREQSELKAQERDSGAEFPADKKQRLEMITADIKTANREFQNALDTLGKSETSVAARVDDIKDEKNLQSALAALSKETKSGTVAIYTVIGTDEKAAAKFGWVILVTPKERKAYPIDIKDLEKTVFEFRSALTNDLYDPQPLAEKLYTAIFRQTSEKQKRTLEADLKEILAASPDKTIMWSLDGVLRYVPMAALHDGENYLVEKYRHVVFTKESLLWLMSPASSNRNALGLGVSEKRENFNPLPGVVRELSDIIKQNNDTGGILDGTRKLNADFKKSEILNLSDSEYGIVHIASHYKFDATDPNASFLLVGDGRLTFEEMREEQNLFGTVDLLTLSACDTATSGNGKENEGFAYLAQSLGVKSVIASLWEVSDAGTPELMIRFYKLRSENPQMSKGEAFRKAQLAMLGAANAVEVSGNRSGVFKTDNQKIELPKYKKDEKKPFAHPHYWAAFVLIGNWR